MSADNSNIQPVKYVPLTPKQAERKADELVQILAIWGLSRDDARRVGLRIMTSCVRMTNDDFEARRQGMILKAPDPKGYGN